MFCVDHGGLTRFPLLTIIAIFWLGVPTTICNIFSYLYYKYKMYFYSRTGDTHNDISTQSTAQQYSYSDKYIHWGGILNWGLGWPRLCFSFVEHVFELKLVHDKCQDYCWGRDWQWGASDASQPSRINPNQTRIKFEKTNSRNWLFLGEIEVGSAHSCLLPPAPHISRCHLHCLLWIAESQPGARVGRVEL